MHGGTRVGEPQKSLRCEMGNLANLAGEADLAEATRSAGTAHRCRGKHRQSHGKVHCRLGDTHAACDRAEDVGPTEADSAPLFEHRQTVLTLPGSSP